MILKFLISLIDHLLSGMNIQEGISSINSSSIVSLIFLQERDTYFNKVPEPRFVIVTANKRRMMSSANKLVCQKGEEVRIEERAR